MSEIYDKVYRPIGEATFGHRVFRELFIDSSDLAVDTAFVNNDLTVDFYGMSRQAFKVLPIHTGGGSPTVDVEIEEFLSDSADPTQGTWARKSGLGVGVASPNVLFEHHSEDTMRLTRLVLTPRTAVVDGGIRVEISGRRDT